MSQRYQGIDICRIIFSVFVVFFHLHFLEDIFQEFGIINSIMASAAVPFFFFISGFFFAGKLKKGGFIKNLLPSIKNTFYIYMSWRIIRFLISIFQSSDPISIEFLYLTIYKLLAGPPGALWFIMYLIYAKLAWSLMQRISHKHYIIYIIFLLFPTYFLLPDIIQLYLSGTIIDFLSNYALLNRLGESIIWVGLGIWWYNHGSSYEPLIKDNKYLFLLGCIIITVLGHILLQYLKIPGTPSVSMVFVPIIFVLSKYSTIKINISSRYLRDRATVIYCSHMLIYYLISLIIPLTLGTITSLLVLVLIGFCIKLKSLILKSE